MLIVFIDSLVLPKMLAWVSSFIELLVLVFQIRLIEFQASIPLLFPFLCFHLELLIKGVEHLFFMILFGLPSHNFGFYSNIQVIAWLVIASFGATHFIKIILILFLHLLPFHNFIVFLSLLPLFLLLCLPGDELIVSTVCFLLVHRYVVFVIELII